MIVSSKPLSLFQPTQVVITVESLEEMNALYHLINLGQRESSPSQANFVIVQALARELLPFFIGV